MKAGLVLPMRPFANTLQGATKKKPSVLITYRSSNLVPICQLFILVLLSFRRFSNPVHHRRRCPARSPINSKVLTY